MGAYPMATRPMATGAYSQIPAPGNPAQTEAWALIETARRIQEGAATVADDPEPLKEAVRLNWRLWTLFQANLSLEECGVPDSLRSNMLNLCGFVDKRSVAILIDPAVESVQVLVDINRNIAGGLLAGAEHAAQAAQSAQTVSDPAAPAGPALTIQSA